MNIVLCALSRSGRHGLNNWLFAHLQHAKPNASLHNQFDMHSMSSTLVEEGSYNLFSLENDRGSRGERVNSFPKLLKPTNPINSIQSKNFLLIRDHYNWLASLGTVRGLPWHIESSSHLWPEHRKGTRIEAMLQLWKEQAEYALSGRKEFTILKYNKWFSSIRYRKSIIKSLGLTFSDENIDHVEDRGGGSSFDACNFSTRAQKMKVLARYKTPVRGEKAIDKPEYRKLICNKRLVELSRELFNFKCPI